MKLTGNTIFITGGGSGIGRGLAETLHRLGNQVIISGRRKGHLAETTKANPGMKSVELDIQDPASLAAVTKKLIEDHPKLNALAERRSQFRRTPLMPAPSKPRSKKPSRHSAGSTCL